MEIRKTKAFASFESELELRVFANLQHRGKLDFSVFLHHSPKEFYFKRQMESAFPAAQTVTTIDLIVNASMGKLEPASSPVDICYSLGSFLEEAELMLDRFDVPPELTVRERKRVASSVLGFWIQLFRQEKIQYAYFTGVPHEFADYLAYVAASHLGIRILMMHDAHVLGGRMLANQISTPWSLARDLDLKCRVTQAIAPALLERYSADGYVEMPKYARDSVERQASARSLRSQVSAFFAQFQKFVRHNPRNLLRPGAGYSLLVTATSAALRRYRLRKLKHWTSDNSVDGNALRQYPTIIFFLHYEPEMTVNPLGDVKGSQLSAFQSVLTALPTGWRLCVKDHPSRFDPMSSGLFSGLQIAEYRSMLSDPRVSLLRPDLDLTSLLESCQMVATISGTVGWEASMRGVPTVIFGNAWYEDMPLVHRVRPDSPLSQADLIAHFERRGIENLKEMQERGIREMLSRTVDIQVQQHTCEAIGQKWDVTKYEANLLSVLLAHLSHS